MSLHTNRIWQWCSGISVLLLCASSALATPWNLPTPLGDDNAKLSFEVDTTWHTVHGTTTGISGRVWLEDPLNPGSIRAEISAPVAKFDTDNGSRDEELREVMAEPQFPQVKFELSSADVPCDPVTMQDASKCSVTLHGALTIRSTSKEMTLPAVVERQGQNFVVSGHFPITWGEYQVEDPSMLIARVDPTATISFEVTLRGQTAHE